MMPRGSADVVFGNRITALVEFLWIWIAAALFVSTACTGVPDDSNGAVCNRPGDEWCDGNMIVACLESQTYSFIREGPFFVQGIDCREYGGVCVSWKVDSEQTVARCAVEGSECDSQSDPICVDDRTIAYCEPLHQYVMYGCAGGYCAVDVNGQAVCAFASGNCSEGAQLCPPNSSVYYGCVDGTWADEHYCAEDHVCVQVSSTEVDCVSE